MGKPARTVVVIGAGIVGVSAGIWLRRAGLEVILLDRASPGQGTSFGNAGVLAASSLVPVTRPGLVASLPRLLTDRNAPLFIRWPYLPRMFPWLLKYLGHAGDAATRRIALGLAPLVGDTVTQHRDLARGTRAEAWLADSDYVFAYRDRAAFEASAYEWTLRAQAGFVPELIEGADRIGEYEPFLTREVELLAVLKEHGFVRNPGEYVADLSRVLLEEGGSFRQARVEGFAREDGTLRAVQTDQGSIPADAALIATGVWSGKLLDSLGLRIPLESERGYHILFQNPSHTPQRPVILASGKFVATPMAHGLRCAGLIEFGGLQAAASRRPLAMLRRQVHHHFPQLTAASSTEWLGHRPAPADSLPLIGQIGNSGIYTAFGHHHIGLTAGPKTGRLVSQLIAGDDCAMDLSSYHPQRFG